MFKIGDFVEVDIGMALYAKGEIITENAYRNNDDKYRDSLLAWSLARATNVVQHNPSSFKIKFLDGSTHTANPEELRVLPEKEQFVLKLKGGGDKELAKIYEILDERANGK